MCVYIADVPLYGKNEYPNLVYVFRFASVCNSLSNVLSFPDYLCNVVDALGIHPSQNLKHIEELLKLPLSQ